MDSKKPLALVLGIAAIVVCLLLIGCSKQTLDSPEPTAQQPRSIPGKALDAGKSAECRAQLSQIRQGIEVFKVSDGQLPASLADLGLSVPETFFRCPVSQQPYVYSPDSGTVHCTTAQHANY